eukprot:SAG22_NODE_575_length_8991_cov_12.134859_6_plen_89_part_00
MTVDAVTAVMAKNAENVKKLLLAVRQRSSLLKAVIHCLSFCFSAFPCGSTALTLDRCNQSIPQIAARASQALIDTKAVVSQSSVMGGH